MLLLLLSTITITHHIISLSNTISRLNLVQPRDERASLDQAKQWNGLVTGTSMSRNSSQRLRCLFQDSVSGAMVAY